MATPLITRAVLVQAIIAVGAMGMTERLALSDEIFAEQPNLLASILVLHRMGVSLKDIEVPLHVLFVAHRAMKASGYIWPLITEEIQDICMRRLTARIRFVEGLPSESIRQSVEQSMAEHTELELLAFAYGHLRDHNLASTRTEAEKYICLAALSLVDCIAHIAPQAQIRPST
jgi:hypothetical protein